MKHHNLSRPGYILMLTLMMIALSCAIITYLINKSIGMPAAMRTFAAQDKAHMLALGGIELAMSQLAAMPEEEKETQKKKEQAVATEQSEPLSLLSSLLPMLGRWQTFSLKAERDGVAGTLALCIMCEDGKLDINSIYDARKKQFVLPNGQSGNEAIQKLFERIKIIHGGENLWKSFEKFLKDRQYKLNDVTELLTIKDFEVFKKSVWYEPPNDNVKAVGLQEKKRTLYLTDIFTVWSGKPTIEPWLLSDGLCAILECKRVSGSEAREKVKTALKQFTVGSVWDRDWDKQLKGLYEKEYKMMPSSIQPYFSSTFQATTFSVLSYAKIGTTIRKLLAIIERVTHTTQNTPIRDKVSIKKIYWL